MAVVLLTGLAVVKLDMMSMHTVHGIGLPVGLSVAICYLFSPRYGSDIAENGVKSHPSK